MLGELPWNNSEVIDNFDVLANLDGSETFLLENLNPRRLGDIS
jgi:hypothetical protein